jgi:hypothetical protein
VGDWVSMGIGFLIFYPSKRMGPWGWIGAWRGEVFLVHLWVLGFWNWNIKCIWVPFLSLSQMPNHNIYFYIFVFVNLVHFIYDL